MFWGLRWCGQMKLLTSPAKNWWQPSPPREARAPGLALGKPPGFTTLAPLSCFVDRASTLADHGTCFDPSCHWTLLYQFGSIKMPVHAIFLPNSIGFYSNRSAFRFSRSVFSKRQGIFKARQVDILITLCMHGSTLWGKHESTLKTGNEKSLQLGYQINMDGSMGLWLR